MVLDPQEFAAGRRADARYCAGACRPAGELRRALRDDPDK
jgi:hypothetical protein